MCKYCQKLQDLFHHEDDCMGPGIHNNISLTIIGDRLHIHNDNSYISPSDYYYDVVEDLDDMKPFNRSDHYTKKIKYCPFCGKKLEEVVKKTKYLLGIDFHVQAKEMVLALKDSQKDFEVFSYSGGTRGLVYLTLNAEHVEDFMKTYLKRDPLKNYSFPPEKLDDIINELKTKYNATVQVDNRNLLKEHSDYNSYKYKLY